MKAISMFFLVATAASGADGDTWARRGGSTFDWKVKRGRNEAGGPQGLLVDPGVLWGTL